MIWVVHCYTKAADVSPSKAYIKHSIKSAYGCLRRQVYRGVYERVRVVASDEETNESLVIGFECKRYK